MYFKQQRDNFVRCYDNTGQLNFCYAKRSQIARLVARRLGSLSCSLPRFQYPT